MAKILEKPIIVALLLSVLAGYLYFFQLDKLALTDPDETFYAQTAKEMVKRSEWLTPYLYGKPQFEKPIFFYWLIGISYKIFGINEFAARFPSAVFGLIGLIAIYLLGRLLFNNRVGLFSAVILATNLEYIILSVGCVTDMALSTFLLLGVFFFFYGQVRKKDYFYILSAAAFALATLTKGPIGILLPGFILFVYLLATKNMSFFKKTNALLWSAIVFILIALPWFAIMYKLHAKAFLNEFFGFQNVTRFLTPEHKTGSQVYYNIPVVFGGFFPWSAFLPLGLWHIFNESRLSAEALAKAETTNHESRTTKNASIFILLWFLIIFIFFSISSTKLPTYIFPCFISLALIVGKLWDDFLRRQEEKFLLSGMKASYYFLATAVALTLIGSYIFIRMDYPCMLPGSVITALFVLFGALFSLTAFIKKRFLASFFLIAYMMAVSIYPAAMLALPGIEGYETAKGISKAIVSYLKEGDILASERDFRAGVTFYTDKVPVLLDGNQSLSDLFGRSKRVFGVLKQKNVIDSRAHILYQFGEKRLLTNIPDGKI